MIVYKSNKAKVGDGIRITRVSNNGQTLEVLTDPKLVTWSEIVIAADVPPPPPPPVNNPPVITPGTLTAKV